MIRLSNGYEFKYMAASGALEFDGKGWPHERYLLSPISQLLGYVKSDWEIFNPSLFTVAIKTLTWEPRKGNFHLYWPLGCIRPIFQNGRIVGIVNAVGLTNPGIDWWCRKIGPKVDSRKIALVGSIFSDDMDMTELIEMARKLDRFDFVALEINASCPNTERGILMESEKIVDGCRTVRAISRFPLILKLSVVHDINAILPEIKGIIEAISINSVPWRIVFPNKKSPLAHLGGGGVSGKIAQPYTWDFVKKLVCLTSIPVIGPSVWEFEDIEKLRKIGAKAISFGSIFLRYPWRPTQFVRKDIIRNQI